jgi:glyoxylase-like metal-dependent hydrolase (beta-lactamase superfamily II)
MTPMLHNRIWQPLPGTNATWIYPYIRRADILSSNSFLIRTPAQLVLVDAGALPEQTAELRRVAAECHARTALPLVVFLTHCHLDHCLQASGFRENPGLPSWIAAHAWGAEALSAMDSHKTVADLYGLTMPRVVPEISLFSPLDRDGQGQRRISLPWGGDMVIAARPRPWSRHRPALLPGTKDEAGMLVVTLAGGERMEIHATPGHSPDSVCIRIGEILFLGDLLAATCPLVAGISGWNQEQLMLSLDRMIHVLETEPIQYCCPAHGGMLTAEKTRALLLRTRSQALGLTNLEEVTLKGVFQVMEMALELLDEAEEVFSSLAGRLLYVAHHLDALEEPGAAQRCREALPMDEIDACLAEMRTLCRELDAGRMLPIHFTHEALAVVGKINKLFNPRQLVAILPETLVYRASCLLLDFLAVARSTRNVEEYIPTDLSALLEDLDAAWRSSPHQDPSILDCVDDRERYLAELTRRIGHPPMAQRAKLILNPREVPVIRIAAARLSDTLIQFLEWLSLARPGSITLAVEDGCAANSNAPVLRISPEGWNNTPGPRQSRKIASFTRRIHIAGMTMDADDQGFRLTPLSALA